MTLELSETRGQSWPAFALATLSALAAIALSVLAAGFFDGLLTHATAAPLPVGAGSLPRMPVGEFLAHGIAGQAGLLVGLFAILALVPQVTSFRIQREHVLPTAAATFGAFGLNATGSWLMKVVDEAYVGFPELAGPRWAAAVVVVAGIAAPVIEELFFRDAVLVRLLGRAPRAYAVALTSIAFGALHFPAGGIVLALTLTALALVFGWLRERTGSVGPPVVAHAANNLCALAAGWLS